MSSLNDSHGAAPPPDCEANGQQQASTQHLSSEEANYEPNNIFRSVEPVVIAHRLLQAADPETEQTEGDHKLIHDIETSSDSERTFALKVLESSRLLQAWCDELESWRWDGDFEVPQSEQENFGGTEPHSVRKTNSEQTDQGTALVEAESIAKNGYWGSLRRESVVHSEDRINTILQDLDKLDVDSQKAHVLNTHTQAVSMSSSSITGGSINAPQLDAFTTAVTMAIMHALPDYSYLSSLIESWQARLGVLRQVPQLLNELEDAQKALDAAWLAIGVRQDRSLGLRRARTIKVGAQGMFRESFERIRDNLEDTVARLGQRIDAMLDMLEGHRETLPDKWIDTVEGFEIDYSSWTVEAQKKVLQYEFRLDLEQNRGRQTDSGKRQAGPMDKQAKLQTRARSRMPGAWSDNESDEEAGSTLREQPGEVIFTPAIAFNDEQLVHEQRRNDAELAKGSPERPLSRSSVQSNHTDIIRQHIRRHASQPGIKASSRPKSVGSLVPKNVKLPPLPSEVGEFHAAREIKFQPMRANETSQPDQIRAPTVQSTKIQAEERNSRPIEAETDFELKSMNGDSCNSTSVHSGLQQEARMNHAANERPSYDSKSARYMLGDDFVQSHNAFPSSSWPLQDPRTQPGVSNSKRLSLPSQEGLPKRAQATDRARSPKPSKIIQRQLANEQRAAEERYLRSSSGKPDEGHSLLKRRSSPFLQAFGGSASSVSLPLGSRNDSVTSLNLGSTQSERFSFTSTASSGFLPLGDHRNSPIINLQAQKNMVNTRESGALSTRDRVSSDTLLQSALDDTPDGTFLREPESELRARSRTPSPAGSQLSTVSQLQKHLDAILTTVPLNIKLINNDELSPHESLQYDYRNELSPECPYVIAPASWDERRASALSAHSNIKLYHLRTIDRPTPLKLYLRVVGEGGHQVMVRVKGGWVDFGDFLRDFVAPNTRGRKARRQNDRLSVRATSTASMASASSFFTNLPSVAGDSSLSLPYRRTPSRSPAPPSVHQPQISAGKEPTTVSNLPANTKGSRGSIVSPLPLRSRESLTPQSKQHLRNTSADTSPNVSRVAPIRSLSGVSKRQSLTINSALPLIPSSGTTDKSHKERNVTSPTLLSSPSGSVSIVEHTSSSSIDSRANALSSPEADAGPAFAKASWVRQRSPASKRSPKTDNHNLNKRDSWLIGRDIIESSKAEMDEDKQKWVTEMMERARKQWGRHAPSFADLAEEEERKQSGNGLGITDASHGRMVVEGSL